MTDRDALHSLLIYAQREAAAQDLEVVSQLLTLTIANLAPASRTAADTGFDGASTDGDGLFVPGETLLQ